MDTLNQIEARILGALIEKDVTTPEYYPLSLNALVAACNQKSNREPVMDLDDEAVRTALYALEEKGLAGPASGTDSRVTKYEHRMQEKFNFTRGETAVICVLLLRGPQTPGELRGRSERMHSFAELADVQSTLQRLMQRAEPLVTILPKQPGTKESRYAHLFCGEDATGKSQAQQDNAAGVDQSTSRIEALELEVEDLRRELSKLREDVQAFQRRFE